MYNNYKLNIYFDLRFKDYACDHITEFITYDYKLSSIIKEPVFDFYTIEAGEIHIKQKIIESKLLQVMYK